MKLSSPWLVIAATVLSFLLGSGLPFSDYATFQAWVAAHFPQVAGLGFLLPVIWSVLQKLIAQVRPETVQQALNDGLLDPSELGAILRQGGAKLASAAGSATADACYLALFHEFESDEELTKSLDQNHSLYRMKRVGRAQSP